ncbi:DEAD/DEAH box helicase [Arthrobacter sp. 24S4-2]|uniref:protein DpdJ n=1 Tax=Arthrobacter sp. 24S4-2 TaxID=2575374 RepID=UPI0010C7A8C8|nr:protein DpdJ [Arthrobacter sp. 24S4-2]QCO97302.1 DEAD/DEAH box helicase [Arthrobacter sp. 24S4-2]
MGDRWTTVPEVLTALEDLELPRLSWGIVDGFLSEAEVREVLDRQVLQDLHLGTQGPSSDEYLDRLLEDGLLHRVQGVMQPRYRTRLAEGLRLFRRLRQLWVPNNKDATGWWRSGAALVADYRLRVAPRRYPRREISASDVIGRLKRTSDWSVVSEAVAKEIIGERQLARFQVDAAVSVIAAMQAGRTVGRIVTAGTGSGKTLAFYLPALLDLVSKRNSPANTPHTLALYPRNELLRDQAREALIQCRQANRVLPKGARLIRIGLLYSSTPRDAGAFRGGRIPQGWRRTTSEDGWIAPYFPCPTDGCRGDLVWNDLDRSRQVERLKCTTCESVIDGAELALTRRSIAASPPDILFSTTEMLSRSSTSSFLGRVLGWRGNSSIRLVLLDEAHTYAGVHGAQVALMLRRWRYSNAQFGSPAPVFVGLSATLKEAGEYFATLIGTDRSDIEVIGPVESELASMGREYGIVLRGDPASGAALLSTTIQSVMLGARLLDREPGTFGASAFVFTDDLDVTNRLFDNFRDAEGYFNGRPNSRARLADLRVSSDPQAIARYEDGQSWDAAEQLGRLPGGLRVGRTSSQDKGVDAVADVIVATASLEVGFNDPRVGLVVQHKAPSDMASFVQRRGRAGRSLDMRPITLVVLSDYGRDRILYQSYERLLDPEIDARTLPTRNRFVSKIQATHAMLDWLYRRLDIDVRSLLTAPTNWAKAASESQPLIRELEALLRDDSRQASLQEFIQRSLRVSVDDSTAILWDEPRSLMLAAIPTALKRIESGWRSADGQVDSPGGTPLPEFMTGALFEALNSPDVGFDLPPAMVPEEEATMPIRQALSEASPGRVSRRFGFKHASHRSWMALPVEGDDLPLASVVSKGHNLGDWTASDGLTYTVVRPIRLRLTSPPNEIRDSSSATPVWRSSFVFSESPISEVDFPETSAWTPLVGSCGFALHIAGNPLTVRRLAIGSEGEVLYVDGTRQPHSTRYSHEGTPAALGFELEVDAFVVEGELSEVRGLDLAEFAAGPQWRTLAFKTRIEEDNRLDGLANYFVRQALADLYLVAYARNGSDGGDRHLALRQTSNAGWRAHVDAFFRAVYRSDEGAPEAAMKRVRELEQLADVPGVHEVLDEHGRLLVDAVPGAGTGDLLTRAVLDTFASAILAAVHRRVPDAQDADIVVDVVVDERNDTFRIIVSETELGGLGLLEELQRDYATDPRRFWEVVAEMCGPSEYEDVDAAMQWGANELAHRDSRFGAAVSRYRTATSSAEFDDAIDEIRATLDDNDGPASHLLMSTIATRMLRPGSSPSGDMATAYLVKRWGEIESHIGVELDARVIAFHGASGALGQSIAPLNADTAFAALWLRGPSARNVALNDWQPYAANRLRERLVLSAVVADKSVIVDVASSAWEIEYLEAIARDGAVRLSADFSHREQLARALRMVTALPIDVGALRVYGQLRKVARQGRNLVASVALAEGKQ